MYTTLINHYFTTKIFIGQDSGQCASSDSPNKDFSIGNSILLQIQEFKYVFIDPSITEFNTTDDIIFLFSLIGRNDVPYPVLLGTQNVYFMLDKIFIPLSYFPPNMKPTDYEDAYQMYYSFLSKQNNEKETHFSHTYKLSADAKTFSFF